MTSEAAQKAYDEIQWMTMTELLREAFDRGAVEALRRAAAQFEGIDENWVVENLNRMADNWEAGQ